MTHPCGLSRLHPTMKRRTNTQRRLRPKLPKIPEEMRQWSDLLLREILGWPDVSSRPMFGMTAVYRGNVIFGVLPRTRAIRRSRGRCTIIGQLTLNPARRTVASLTRQVIPPSRLRRVPFTL